MRRISGGVVIVALWLGGGCAGPGATSGGATKTPIAPLNQPAGISQSMQVVAGVLPLGEVPYDNMALPLPSPDARFVAVQAGAPPNWPTILAEPGAEVPVATRIEIYELDWRESIEPKERKQPALAATVTEPVLLGRSCDTEGFLVESPREDGSRWIGKASWTTGEISWLVDDSNINAFASLGPDGRLAWSRRTSEARRFDLVVRTGGTEFMLSAPAPESEQISEAMDGWLLPTWSARGDSLFAFQLSGGHLTLRHMIGSSAAAANQSMLRLSLSFGADVYTAYQAISPQPTVAGMSSPSGGDQIVFYHPSLRRVALWRPLALQDRQRTQLNAGSVAALVDQEDFAFVATSNHLIRQNLRRPSERMNLVAGLQIPRPTMSPSWPYLLLSPGEGRVGIIAMRLLPREQSILSSR